MNSKDASVREASLVDHTNNMQAKEKQSSLIMHI